MKKLVFLSLIMGLAFSNIKAQLTVIPATGYVGCGTTTPKSQIDIGSAGAAIGSYAGVTAAPSNGLIVSGNVGFGTTSPNNLLQVANLINFNNTLYNTLWGYYAGASSTGNYNTINGYKAGYSNTSSSGNTFSGFDAGYSNTTGSSNTCIGIEAGYSNTTNSYGTFVGAVSGLNTTGYYNTFLGYSAGYANTSGYQNTFIGMQAGHSNTTVGNNTFVGYNAGYSNTTGTFNCSLGVSAGTTITTGDSNTFIGTAADAGAAGLNNCAAYGYKAVAASSDKMYFGNVNVKACYANSWVSTSDGRFKINVKEDVKGLEFINKLRPVTYNMDTKALDAFLRQNIPQPTTTDSAGNAIPVIPGNYTTSTAIIHSGFIAQEVDSVAKACGFQSSIVSEPSNSNDPYALSYGEFVVPLVKAVQELSKTNDSLKSALKTTDSLLTVVQKQFNITTTNLQQQINSCCNKGSLDKTDDQTGINDNNTGITVPVLYQNNPNPFSQQTQIKCFIPSNAMVSNIYIYDMQGTQIKEVQINGTGNEAITIQGSELKAGMYMYSLIIDGKVIDTKKMVLTD